MAQPTEATVIIVGGGPSGLATAAYLRHLSIPYLLLEREDCFASIWHKYAYDRVHLHIAKQFCHLPLMPIPSTYSTYLSRNEFLRYLNDYVSYFDINPMYRRSVEAAEYDDTIGKWKVKARNLSSDEVEDYSSRFLVVATGQTCDPNVPEIDGVESFNGEILHSIMYKNGKRFDKKSVLVVGSGNSGMEIAFDLVNSGAKTSIVVRSPVHILARGMSDLGLILLNYYMPCKWVDSILKMMSKIVYGDYSKYGIQRPKEGPNALRHNYGKYPIIDVGTFAMIKSGHIQVLPGIQSIKGNNILFENEKEHIFDVIIFATGFKRSNQWLKGDDYLLGKDGLPKPDFSNHWKGKNGLYCVGLAHRGLYGSAMDAQNVAHDIKAHLF